MRLAGSGTGALVATLLALGYNSQQLEQLLNFDIRKFTRGIRYIGLQGAPKNNYYTTTTVLRPLNFVRDYPG